MRADVACADCLLNLSGMGVVARACSVVWTGTHDQEVQALRGWHSSGVGRRGVATNGQEVSSSVFFLFCDCILQ